MATCVVLITVPDAETGKKLAELLVGEKLAACVNQIPGITSTYWWEGEIKRDSEQLLVIKTDKLKAKAITKAVKAAHPAEVPEVIALSIKDGNRDYLKWIAQSVETARTTPRKASKGKKTRARKQSAKDRKKAVRAAAKSRK